jgi:hypothetical protein
MIKALQKKEVTRIKLSHLIVDALCIVISGGKGGREGATSIISSAASWLETSELCTVTHASAARRDATSFASITKRIASSCAPAVEPPKSLSASSSGTSRPLSGGGTTGVVTSNRECMAVAQPSRCSYIFHTLLSNVEEDKNSALTLPAHTFRTKNQRFVVSTKKPQEHCHTLIPSA